MPLLDLTTKKGQDALTQLLNDVKTFKKHPTKKVGGPHSLYKPMVDEAREMGIHIWGNDPTELLNITRPREDPEITKYRLDTFQTITKSKADKALTILLKIFNTKLWSIIYRDNEKGKQIQLFLEDNFYLFGDFMLYVQKMIMKNMLADANAVVFYRPSNFDIEQNEVTIPFPVIFESSQILSYIPDTYYILLDAEIFKDKNRDLRQVWIIDRFSIELWRQSISGNGSTLVWVNVLIWVHNFEVVPVWPMGGNVDGRFQGIFYTSFFEPAASHWNKAIISESDLDGAFINHMHPIRIETAEDCDYQWGDQQCINGKIFDETKKKHQTCPICKGSGRKAVKSPYGVYLVNKDKFGADETSLTPVEYVTTPTDPTELLVTRRDRQLDEGLEAINMEIVNQIGENQSGIAKEIDRDALNTTLQAISDHVFTIHIFNFVWFTGIYFFKTASGQDLEAFTKDALSEDGWFPAIVKPTQFDTLTIKELTKQLTDAKDGELSSGYVNSLQVELNNKQFSSNPRLRKRINAITQLNPIPEKSVEEITSMVENNLTTRENAAISLNIEFLVDVAISQDEGFLELPREDKLEILKKLIVDFELLK